MSLAIDRAHHATSASGRGLSSPRSYCASLALFLVAAFHAGPSAAQQVQIPTLQVCNQTKVAAQAWVQIEARVDAFHSGTFLLRGDLFCDASPSGYPTGTLGVFGLSMSDSTVQGDILFTTFEQVTATGKHTPTAWVNGRCKAQDASGAAIVGCRYWLMVADNARAPGGRTPDIVSLFVVDGTGKRIAYGTGPVVDGDVSVAPTSN